MHFDIKNKEFSLENVKKNGKVFDVSNIRNRDIDISDIEIDSIEANDFVIFYTGYLKEVGYGTKTYFKNHPQLSNEVIEMLIEKEVSIIGMFLLL